LLSKFIFSSFAICGTLPSDEKCCFFFYSFLLFSSSTLLLSVSPKQTQSKERRDPE